MIQAAIAVTSLFLVLLKASRPSNSLITDFCQNTMEIAPEDKTKMDFVYALISQ
jgi:hypothetical protein